MSLSLCLVLLMCFVVLPVLLWAFFTNFSAQTPETVEISPHLLKNFKPESKVKNHQNTASKERAIPMTDFKSMLSVPLSDDYCHTVYETIKIIPTHRNSFRGYELWQAIINAGFVYDSIPTQKRFFHYYNDAHSKIVFSLMPLSCPFEFVDTEMGEFETDGLLLLLYDKNESESMLDIAQLLAEELEGKVTFEHGEQRGITTEVASIT